MKITLLHNPKAGNGKPEKEELIETLESEGYKVAYQSTKEKGVKKAIREAKNLIAVAGGDGAVGKVLRKIKNKKIPVAILPVGTANNIAKSLGIKGTYKELIESWAKAGNEKFSIGEVELLADEHKFIESVGYGIICKLINSLSSNNQDEKNQKLFKSKEEKLKTALRKLIALVTDFSPSFYTITVDGKDVSSEFILVEVMNIRSISTNIKLAPKSHTTDELLDLVLISEKEKGGFIKYLQSLEEGKPFEYSPQFYQGKSVIIKTEDQCIHIDDKIYQHDKNYPVNFSVKKFVRILKSI